MISVAMAVYNGEKYLKTQLESILSQTEPVDEIIIVDDGSSDNSVEILRKYSQKDTRFKIFQNRTNLGYKQNFRKAISLCHGDMIFLSDQDDCWFPEKVRTMKAVMENHPDIETLASSFVFMDDQGNDYQVKSRKGMSNNNMYLKPVQPDALVPVTFDEFCSHNYFQGCSMALTRAAADKFLNHWSDILPHDWLIALLSSHDGKFWFINKPLFHYRTHSQNTIGVPKGKKGEEWVRLKFAEDMLDVMETIKQTWPEEYYENDIYQKRSKFCAEHIQALKSRNTWQLIKENTNPVYGELKTKRARMMDLVFSLFK